MQRDHREIQRILKRPGATTRSRRAEAMANYVLFGLLLVFGRAACDAGNPLFLTPLIKNNQTQQARTAAAVSHASFQNVTSYAGYFTVDETFNSNLFFWFFPSKKNVTNDPVILYLQGGPGLPSIRSLFEENGPFTVDENLNISLRKFTWNRNHSVLYIDNPVGVGYSFTNGGYAQNQTIIAQHLYEALTQFFTVFPEFSSRAFYVSGVSYGGKYSVSLASYIDAQNEINSQKINLQGVIVESGFVDPVHQANYSDYLYQLGLIDKQTRNLFKDIETTIITDINNGNYQDAMDNYAKIIVPYKGPTLFRNLTGFDNGLNYLEAVAPPSYYRNFVTQDDVRSALHVGNTNFTAVGFNVFLNLLLDYPKSVAPQIVQLLTKYRMVFYNGQTDVVGGNFLTQLNFPQAAEYNDAPRIVWHFKGDVAGYAKQAGNLTEVLVRNAGHWVARYQPEWAYNLVLKFTRNRTTFN
ncbi:venom serine carboxypeptidase-like [Cylas formicarius]|uniref:venom serine carboxypeptidase-like n=1 Tax=Cylas formicarius TaxID=197179 RepID=UPI002958D96F|nr:venom serine carboxypeptidase-like [Cylas formicarius]